MVKNAPYNAGDSGSIPGQGTKMPHAVGQLSLRELQLLSSRASARARVPQTTEPPRSGTRAPQLQSPQALGPCTAMTDPACLNEDPLCRD